VVLKGPRRGQPLSAKGTDEVLAAARRRAGLDHATCHLRHTCLTRLREAGMALEAVQAQADPRPARPPAAVRLATHPSRPGRVMTPRHWSHTMIHLTRITGIMPMRARRSGRAESWRWSAR
jgi:hypothetical protein